MKVFEKTAGGDSLSRCVVFFFPYCLNAFLVVKKGVLSIERKDLVETGETGDEMNV